MKSGGAPVALVTGASSGIGRATAALLGQSGYKVYGGVRTVRPEAEIPGVSLLGLDVRNTDSIRSAIESIIGREQRIDVLVNNAGVALVGGIEETAIEQAESLLDTNFFGVARVTRAVLPTMRNQGHGRIINISSVVGFIPAPYMGYYSASKHALEGYTESLDHEIKPFGVRAVAVEPSFTRTALASNSLVADNEIAEYQAVRKRVQGVVETRVSNGVEPHQVARVVLRAARAKYPKHRYPVGGEGAALSVMRRFMPPQMFDWGLRKQFSLEG